MKKVRGLQIFVVTIIMIAIASLMYVSYRRIQQEQINVKELDITTNNAAENNTNFGIQFLKYEYKNSNIVYSPLSIKYALNMMQKGASGNTEKQITNVVRHLTNNKYTNVEGKLGLANGVFIRNSFRDAVDKDYITVLKNSFNAEVNYDSFANANAVNSWIEKNTLGIIKDMVSDSTVQDTNNQLLLINALAIDMEWQEKFDSSDTWGRDFHLDDGTTMNATTMFKKTFNDQYFVNDKVTALAMDLKEYDNTQLQFVAIMPNKEKLSTYVDNFTVKEFNNIMKGMKNSGDNKAGAEVTIPKFKYNFDMSLKEDLQKLGIHDAFDKDNADFSKMVNDDTKKLYVGDAIHKADIDFSEDGIKAAASTVIIFTAGAAFQEEKPVELTFDKPFMYFIRDKKTNEIWFIGIMQKPNSWDEEKNTYSIV